MNCYRAPLTNTHTFLSTQSEHQVLRPNVIQICCARLAFVSRSCRVFPKEENKSQEECRLHNLLETIMCSRWQIIKLITDVSPHCRTIHNRYHAHKLSLFKVFFHGYLEKVSYWFINLSVIQYCAKPLSFLLFSYILLPRCQTFLRIF